MKWFLLSLCRYPWRTAGRRCVASLQLHKSGFRGDQTPSTSLQRFALIYLDVLMQNAQLLSLERLMNMYVV